MTSSSSSAEPQRSGPREPSLAFANVARPYPWRAALLWLRSAGEARMCPLLLVVPFRPQPVFPAHTGLGTKRRDQRVGRENSQPIGWPSTGFPDEDIGNSGLGRGRRGGNSQRSASDSGLSGGTAHQLTTHCRHRAVTSSPQVWLCY
jgi:hypothetical protein